MRFFGWSPIFLYECWLRLSKIIFLWGEILKFIAGLKKTNYLCALQVSCRVVSGQKKDVLDVIFGDVIE